MITSGAWSGKRYAVLGLARSGKATVRALVASGAHVVGWDENGGANEQLWESLKADRVEIGSPAGFVQKDWLKALDLIGFEAVIVSPGVPLNLHPVVEKAKRFGLPIIGDIELFAQARPALPPHRVVGITGTNGKSTTTALVHHILETAGVPTTMGGNIGLPILEQEPLPDGGVYVLELSSYQIDLTYSLDCDVAVLLNITPDHLDRYESFDDYAASKARLFAMQSRGRAVIIDFEADEDHGVVPDHVSFSHIAHENLPADQKDWPALQGPHNWRNAQAAVGVCRALGVGEDAILGGLRSYPGLPHRMERVAEIGGVAWVNDSKGTNTAATAPALAAFDNVHWIVGGLAKEPGLGECEAKLGHVKAAYTIGKSGEDFARLLEGRVRVTRSGTLDQAVLDSANDAEPGDTVLLSPACASFDQFRDFEHRGEAFRAAVRKLQGAAA